MLEVPKDIAYITFENFWNEKLKVVKLRYESLNSEPFYFELYDVEPGEVRENIGRVEYSQFKDYWFLELETITGNHFKTKNDFYCNINYEDEDGIPILIGVNGDDSTMYVRFEYIDGCRTELFRS